MHHETAHARRHHHDHQNHRPAGPPRACRPWPAQHAVLCHRSHSHRAPVLHPQRPCKSKRGKGVQQISQELQVNMTAGAAREGKQLLLVNSDMCLARSRCALPGLIKLNEGEGWRARWDLDVDGTDAAELCSSSKQEQTEAEHRSQQAAGQQIKPTLMIFHLFDNCTYV